MGKKLYVGNLAYAVTSEELENLFSKHGPMTEAEVVSDRYSGRSKGFGFVEYETPEQAAEALEALHGTEFAGRTLKIDFAKENSRRRDA